MNKPKIIVIGGGASGIMAAGQAALKGAEVLLVEKMESLGKKLRISGKGRCNLTNYSEKNEFISHFNRSRRFLHQPFSRFFATELMDFFKSLGVDLVIERGNRVFPASGKSSEVVDALLTWLRDCGVQVSTKTSVSDLLIKQGSVVGVRCGEQEIYSDAIVLSTGGSSYPATGSTGEGYVFAQNAGHSIVPLRPALIPLLVQGSPLHRLAGLDLKNVGIRIYINGKRRKSDFGEMSFTRSAIGGPVILTHSLFMVDSLQAGKKVEVAIDLKPALTETKLDNRLQRDFQKRTNEQLASVLRGLLPEKLVQSALGFCAIDGNKLAGRVTSSERSSLRSWLKDFRLQISGHRPLQDAIITAGGINVKEIDPNTMESKIVKGLYITGELLDINGETGGYNLQAAFSTGWIAGRSAAQSCG